MSRTHFWDITIALPGIVLLSLDRVATKDSPDKPLPPALGKLERADRRDGYRLVAGKASAIRFGNRYAAAFPLYPRPSHCFKIQYLSPNRFLTNPGFLAQRNCLVGDTQIFDKPSGTSFGQNH